MAKLTVRNTDGDIGEAFNSMLRTDYISLNDTEKLSLLSQYYIDYFGVLPDVLSDTDQLIVGRRGTGKTTLLYRALVGCYQSWTKDYKSAGAAKPRTLGIYIDLSKCQYIEDVEASDFAAFEHAFVNEVCDCIGEQLIRFWPALADEPGVFSRLFKAAEVKRISEVRQILDRIGKALLEGMPRVIDRSAPITSKNASSATRGRSAEINAALKSTNALVGAKTGDTSQSSSSSEQTYSTQTTYRLTMADVLQLLDELRVKADLSATYLFIDEFSALSSDLQRRFSTLLKKLLGTHAGVFIKLCAITDKYTLGSSIILQRDLFELSLDLDAFVERAGTLKEAHEGLRDFSRKIIESRFAAYKCPKASEVFDDVEDAYTVLSRSSMGVPRTLGIVLKQAYSRSRQSTRQRAIRKTDISYGVRYASSAYLNQLLGAARDGVAVPAFYTDMWSSLLSRAQNERRKSPDGDASHFMVLEKNDKMLSVLNMFFLVHLVTKGRTTKKEKSTRSLYCFDYGVCEENNLGFSTDKNIIRQQRFAYDEVMEKFERYFGTPAEETFRCPSCNTVYAETELKVAGIRLNFCPRDKTDLVSISSNLPTSQYTEEETKIIGTIRSASRDDEVFARRIADDVGCYVQKVSKFGEKLEKIGLAARERHHGENKLVYFSIFDADAEKR
ncbi:hypothetical protein [Burkholderia gladioli]|uniref:ORC-CDC6 family AAA ATPase n=1 Tax=Burkholderia gladioli TaxID=28095 RepID=UPI001641C197|nr:hypothetical protein [Burkholderia gladioli]